MPSVLKAEVKKGRRKRANRILRGQDKIPAVLYGGKDKPAQMLALGRIELEKVLEQGDRIFQLELEGQAAVNVQLKDLQYVAPEEEIIHVDLYELTAGVKVHLNVPIVLKGEPVGLKKEGVVEFVLRELEVECDVQNVPHEITVDISHLDLNDAIHAGEIALPDGVVLPEHAEQLVVSVKPPRGPEEEAAPAEGELAEGEAPAEGAEGEAKAEESKDKEE